MDLSVIADGIISSQLSAISDTNNQLQQPLDLEPRNSPTSSHFIPSSMTPSIDNGHPVFLPGLGKAPLPCPTPEVASRVMKTRRTVKGDTSS